MQSAFWKAVALTGVIGVGCFVVYEVHRRMPKQQGQPTSVSDFQGLDEQQAGEGTAGGTGGTSVVMGELDGSAPPLQQEPGDEPFDAAGGPAVADADGAAPWESIPQRSESAPVVRDSSFLDVIDSTTTSGAESAGAPRSRSGPSEAWMNDAADNAGDSSPQPLLADHESPARTRHIQPAGGAEFSCPRC